MLNSSGHTLACLKSEFSEFEQPINPLSLHPDPGISFSRALMTDCRLFGATHDNEWTSSRLWRGNLASYRTSLPLRDTLAVLAPVWKHYSCLFDLWQAIPLQVRMRSRFMLLAIGMCKVCVKNHQQHRWRAEAAENTTNERLDETERQIYGGMD